MVVPVEIAGSAFRPGVPKPLFDATDYRSYRALPDGRFVTLPADGGGTPSNIHVALNWKTEVERLLAATRP
jgi:hypothetical protein